MRMPFHALGEKNKVPVFFAEWPVGFSKYYPPGKFKKSMKSWVLLLEC
jgi:hypothetical protein